MNRVTEIFEDTHLIRKIQQRLPPLFYLAELESSRAGKIGMQVGSIRENIIVALLIYKFGEGSIETEIPITEAEVDVLVLNKPLSIKTISDIKLTGVKLIWTVDAIKAREFSEKYYPKCDMLFTHIVWGGIGGLYFIPLEAQSNLFEKIGRQKYIKLPKPGTNPRGVEITQDAMVSLIHDKLTRSIEINWMKPKIDYNQYKRWIEYWKEVIDEK